MDFFTHAKKLGSKYDFRIGSKNLRILLQRVYDLYKQDEEFVRHILKTWDELNKGLDDMESKEPDLAERAKTLHAAFENLLPQDNMFMKVKEKITCKAGCNFCCHINVDILKEEGQLLLKVAKDIDVERLKLQAEAKTPEEWPNLKKNALCVFNKDGLCTVYENRPLSCRSYFVVSEPKDCDTATANGYQVQVAIAMYPELFTAAVFWRYLLKGGGSMPQVLLKEMAPKLV